MRCPICGRLETGRVAAEQYYCRRCCVEFHGAPGAWRLFSVDEEGNLVAAAPEIAPSPDQAEEAASAAFVGSDGGATARYVAGATAG